MQTPPHRGRRSPFMRRRSSRDDQLSIGEGQQPNSAIGGYSYSGWPFATRGHARQRVGRNPQHPRGRRCWQQKLFRRPKIGVHSWLPLICGVTRRSNGILTVSPFGNRLGLFPKPLRPMPDENKPWRNRGVYLAHPTRPNPGSPTPLIVGRLRKYPERARF